MFFDLTCSVIATRKSRRSNATKTTTTAVSSSFPGILPRKAVHKQLTTCSLLLRPIVASAICSPCYRKLYFFAPRLPFPRARNNSKRCRSRVNLRSCCRKRKKCVAVARCKTEKKNCASIAELSSERAEKSLLGGKSKRSHGVHRVSEMNKSMKERDSVLGL